MTTIPTPTPPTRPSDYSFDNVFKLWSKYEDVTMHFNDLILKLRFQALAGVAGLSAVAGLFGREISEGINLGSVPDNGLPPTTLPGFVWGKEVESVDIRRMSETLFAGGTNFTDWYYPSSGLSTTSGLPSLDSSALSVGRNRRDIENLTQAANIDIPVISFGGSNGLTPVPGSFVAFGQSLAVCAALSCDGTARVPDPNAPNPAFPTLGGVAGGFEAHINEGYAHVDVVAAEDTATNQVIAPLADFIERNLQ